MSYLCDTLHINQAGNLPRFRGRHFYACPDASYGGFVPHISAARVIVEAGLTNYRVDPSQGTHFFQNLTSFGVGYFTINAFMNDGVYNQDFLNAQPAVEETKYLRHVRFEKPMVVKMDGKKKQGVVLMPET